MIDSIPTDFASMGSQKYLWFLLLLFVILVVSNLIHRLIRNLLEKKVGKKKAKIASKVVEYTISSIGLGFGLYYILGVNLGSLVATLGVASVIIGLAAQQIIQNLSHNP